jgi:hypothetical protein
MSRLLPGAALSAGLALLLAGWASGLAAQGDGARDLTLRDSRRDRPERFRRANPSAVVATELAFARAAQEHGQWTAFAKFAADDAVMFVPQTVRAKDWLKKQQNPPQAVRWQPHQVWSSCDGTLAVTKGAWQRPDGTVGYFTTAWKRQRNGEYQWVMDQGDRPDQPLAAPEMIGGSVASCTAPATAPAATGTPGQIVGWSKDKTLQWIVEVAADGSRSLKVHRWTGSGYEEVLRSEVAAG